MHPILQHILAAYRPLYLHGQLRDGPYPWPAVAGPVRPVRPVAAPRQHLLLAALTGLRHGIFQRWSKP